MSENKAERKAKVVYEEFAARFCFLAVPMVVLLTLVANRREQSDSLR